MSPSVQLSSSRSAQPRGSTRSWVVLMVLAVAVVAALAFWDEQRESAAALEDFAQEQATLAASVAADVGTRLSAAQRDARVIAESLDEGRRPPLGSIDGYTSYGFAAERDDASSAPRAGLVLRVPTAAGRTLELAVPPMTLLKGAARLERPGLARVFLLGPDGRLRGPDGSVLESAEVDRALADEATSTWLDRDHASAIGLKHRRAAAGLAHVDGAALGRWAVAVVTSAERVRDRERRAYMRLLFGVGVSAALVVLFGTAALRRQRRGLLLEGELALAALDRKRDAELLTASRAATLGTLAMGIAHEVSTPLGVIAGRAEQLLPKVLGDERAARSVRSILEQAERIRRVIRGFLDVVRGGSPELGDAPPAVVLEGAIALVEHRFAAASVAIERRRSGELPSIRGDVSMLQQALVNLLLNACDACARGGRVTATVEHDGESVVFRVTDDGRGITADEASRAAEPFFTTKAPGHGSGLGLAIASEIVKLHRGRLILEPASPRGTVASVRVPLPKVSPHAAS